MQPGTMARRSDMLQVRIMLVWFEEPINYGIRQGRISKLWMNNLYNIA